MTDSRQIDLLALIKNRKTIRRYKDKQISMDVLDKIIEAGVWGPSIVGYQPWNYLIVQNKKIIRRLYEVLISKISDLNIAGRFVLRPSSEAIKHAQVIICIYNDKSFSNSVKKFGNIYIDISKIAEISSISAAIQNMILIAESLGISSCWLDIPLIFLDEFPVEIRSKAKGDLFSLVTLGYADEDGQRSKRKNVKSDIEFLP